MRKQPIHMIKTLLQEEKIAQNDLEDLRADERKGVQKILLQYDERQRRKQDQWQDFEQKWQFERQFCHEETSLIAGVDEAGRGPLAGPVVAAAVILPKDERFIGLTDSKQLSAKERNTYFDLIKEIAICYHVSIIDHVTIDEVNILEATKRAMVDALTALAPRPTIGLIDAVHLKSLPFPTFEIVKGDDKSVAIAAASVLAKVTRDRIMEDLDKAYPCYAFATHKGYGTAGHLDALALHGPSPYHRKSFAPVRKYMNT